MDINQFRKIYSDFRLAESRAKADQYKAWDYSSQHMSMRAPFDKRQYNPATDKAEENYHREDRFVQNITPKAHLSHLSPSIIGGITSRLAGKDFRDTSVKFITYGDIFNHIDMIPEVVDIVKQTLSPMQAQIFVQNIDSINANAQAPGLLLSNSIIELVKQSLSALMSLRSSLDGNDRRVFKDSLNRLELQTKSGVVSGNLTSKPAELLFRMGTNVLDLLLIKQNKYDEVVSVSPEEMVRYDAANAAMDLHSQNALNAINSVRPQTQLDVRPLRDIEPHLESINDQDYREGATVLNGFLSMVDQYIQTTENPKPVLKSQATSSTKTSSVKTINTDTKSAEPKESESLIEMLRKLVNPNGGPGAAAKDDDEEDDDEDKPDATQTQAPQQQVAPQQQAQAPQQQTQAPVQTTPQGPAMLSPNAPAMVPAVAPPQQIPGTQTQTTEVTQQPEAAAEATPEADVATPEATPVAEASPPVAPAPTAAPVPAAPVAPVTPTPAVPSEKQEKQAGVVLENMLEGPILEKSWPEQYKILSNLPETMINDSFLMKKSYPDVKNTSSIFYVNANERLRLFKILKALAPTIPSAAGPLTFIRSKSGLNKDLTPPDLFLAVGKAIEGDFKAPASEEKKEKPKKKKVRDAVTGRMREANADGSGKPRGRGRPKRVREDDIEESSKKTRVQAPSSLSSFALPAQVSSSPNVLDLHKDDIVKSITVKRSPIPQFMEDLFESLSNGTWSQLKKKHGFDSFFHLAAVINDDILIEKNSNGINVAIYKPYDSEEIKVPAKLLGKMTLGEMVEKVKQDMGPDFYSYHPFENNCQNFMFRFLKDSKALTPAIAEFVSQPIDNLVKDLPEYFPPLVKAAADVYGVVQPLLNNDA